MSLLHLLPNRYRGGGGTPTFTPSELGAKLRHWSEVDGLVVNSTTENGIVDVSGNVSQITDLSGNDTHWIQVPGGVAAAATRPVLSSGKVAFVKTNNNAMYSPALLADIVGNTQGEVIVCYRRNVNTLASYPFCFGQLVNTDKRSGMGILEIGSGTDRSVIFVRDSSVSVQTLQGGIIPNDTLLSHSFSSNGSAYKIVHEFQGERLEETLSVTSGANNGNWFSDVSPDYLGLFCFLGGTDVFHNGEFYAMIICNEQLTVQERSDLFCYLNNKYQVWP